MYPVTPVKCTFGAEGDKGRNEYVWNQITSIEASNAELHTEKVKKWRRLYKGIPKEERRTFPWDGASNLVIQVIGTCVDSLKAKIMGSIYEVMPLYVAQVVGDWPKEEGAEEQRAALEEAMCYFGLEPTELDLYRVESLWFDEAIKFGTSFTKTNIERDTENVVVSIDGTRTEKENVRYSGPRPVKLPFENFGISPTASTLESAEFKYHKIPLTKFQLLERKQRGIYTPSEVEKILPSPDRSGVNAVVQARLEGEGINPQDGYGNAEWDIYECWFPFWHNGTKYRIIQTYHYKTKTVLKCVFNFLPNNTEPFRMARLGYTDDGIYGFGFAEMLKDYQEEVSVIHNQRADNRLLANTAAMRVSRASKLDSIFSIYPGSCIPAEKDEIENLNLGTNYPSSVQEEGLTLALADKRAGVEAGVSGQGGGSTGKKGTSYSAMGTFSVMQQGNRRGDINTTDMRYAHIELGRLVLTLYAHFGIGDKGRIFGKNEVHLKKAFEAVRDGRLVFPIRAATGSINKELEKQNDMMLTNVMGQHYQTIAGLLSAISGPQGQMIPPNVKVYLESTIDGSIQLMKHILRNFGHDDTSRLLPSPEKGAVNGQPTGVSSTNGAGDYSGGASPETQTII